MFNVPMMTLPTSGRPCRSWIFVVVMLFSLMSARRAVLVSFIGAVLFLPQAAITLPSLPDITKISVTSFSVLLAVVMFDTARLLRFRLSWVDLPMLAWCLAVAIVDRRRARRL